jgi:phosphoribosyl 1,2-cyclic phosphodiesterase
MTDSSFLVRIWGARGSASAPAAPNCMFGSDTCCVEMRCGGRVLIFDAGSGVVNLGMQLIEQQVKDFDLFFTHCHLDHIVGLPMLKPLYQTETTARFYAGHLQDGTKCRDMVAGFMTPPYFPVTPDHFKAEVDFRDFRAPDTLSVAPGILIGTVRLQHPNGAVGYRVNFGGRSVCYITDTEHTPGQRDQNILAAIRGADIMIYDCSFTDAEFDFCRNYGHSTWEEGVRLCEAADVKRLVIFHHRPGRNDAGLQAIEAEAQERFPGAIVARTGLELTP